MRTRLTLVRQLDDTYVYQLMVSNGMRGAIMYSPYFDINDRRRRIEAFISIFQQFQEAVNNL